MAKYKLSDVVAEVRDEHPPIEIETDDGRVFTIPPIELWPDGVLEAEGRPLQQARSLLGEDYDAFTAAGGSAALVMHVVKAHLKDRGVDLGESAAS